MNLEEKLKSIKERCEAATEGPLEVIRFDNECGFISYQVEQKQLGGSQQIFSWCSEASNFEKAKQNANFIAHARTDVPMLLNLCTEQTDIIKRICNKKQWAQIELRLEEIVEKYK